MKRTNMLKLTISHVRSVAIALSESEFDEA